VPWGRVVSSRITYQCYTSRDLSPPFAHFVLPSQSRELVVAAIQTSGVVAKAAERRAQQLVGSSWAAWEGLTTVKPPALIITVIRFASPQHHYSTRPCRFSRDCEGLHNQGAVGFCVAVSCSRPEPRMGRRCLAPPASQLESLSIARLETTTHPRLPGLRRPHTHGEL
jgi:hypothetical protein